MIKARQASKTTAICPDCGKAHRIQRVPTGRYIKGCKPPCCVYWVGDEPRLLNEKEMRIAIAKYILVPQPVITQRDLDIGFIIAQAQRDAATDEAK